MTRLRLVASCRAMVPAVLAILWSVPTLAQGVNPVVSDVAVVGNVNISRDAILGVVSIKPGTPFSAEAVARDVAAISDLGYFTRVTHHEEDSGTGIRVIFEVSERARITGIKVTGNTKVTTDKVLAEMTTKVGDVVNVTRFNKDLDRIQSLYRDAGFAAYVDVNSENYLSADGVLSLPIVEIKIEKFEVEKTKKTKPYVILRELRSKPGDVYDSNRLSADMSRLYALGILEDIRYRPEPGSTQDKIIVVLQPTEKKTGQVELGFGYSSQQGLIGRAGLSESNFRGTGTAVGISAEVGGRFRRAGIPSLSVEANYYQPYLDKRGTSFSGSVYNKTTYRFANNAVGTAGGAGQAYEVRRGFSLGLGRPISGYTRIQLSLRNDNVKTYSPQDDLSTDVSSVDTQRASNVASLGLSVVSDTRDDPRNDPSAGHFFTVGTEFGHTKLGGGTKVFGTNESSSGAFFKPAVDYRRYFALAKRKALNVPTKVLAFRVKGGNIQGPVTFFDQYFVGGADSLRGYPEDRFWGKNQLLGNVELRIPFANSLQGVLFSDVGDAWGSGLRGNPQLYANYLNWRSHGGDSNGDGIQDPAPLYSIYDAYEYRMPQHDALKLRFSYGAGVRVKTPIGALRLDYGISKEGKRTHFSISQTF